MSDDNDDNGNDSTDAPRRRSRVIFKRKPKTLIVGPVQEPLQGDPGRDGTDGRDGIDGRDGVDGKDGRDGVDGVDGASAFDIWLAANPGKSKRDYLMSMKPNMGARSVAVGSGGGGLAAVSALRQELKDAGAPRSMTLTRDANGGIETITKEGEDTWTLSRNPDQSVASLTDGTYDVAVDRDGEGIMTGITVTK